MRGHIYYRTSRTRAKGRWFNRKLSDIIGELGPGVVSVSGDPHRIIQNKDIIEFVTHVHEPSTPQKVPVIFQDIDFVVVNKPSGLPTHPSLNYYRNSVTQLLEPEFSELYPCYRLDRLTSGLLILARSADAVKKFHKLQKYKKYLARTQWPHGIKETREIAYNIPVFNSKRGYSAFKTALECAKPARTIIKPISENELSCEPLTGRTHQIRKHLALAGIPIKNDPLYSDGTWVKLVKEPNEKNFITMWENAEKRRTAKMLSSRCKDCNAEMYSSAVTESLDLHCEYYELGQLKFFVDPPWREAMAHESRFEGS